MPPDTARSSSRFLTTGVSTESLLDGEEEIVLIRQALESGQRVELRVNGSCMRPWAFNGDHIAVERLDSKPRRGMILLTQHGDEILVHRVIRLGRDGSILTRGDLSDVADTWVHPIAILGRVAAIRSKHGYCLSLYLPGVPVAGLLTALPIRLLRRILRSRSTA